ncbi:hypothetical protein KKB55_18810, partial [Myxococcota bacterium]|nr:hypothetical protein [Myxococcota bacterium]MBU1899798.1 hypothetical protein [Myxococcota bacterium]
MTDNALDKKLEGRLFNLLEVKARIRLGELVQLRRRSRARNISLLQAAFDASQVSPELARAIAEEAGLEGWGGGRAARDTPGARPRPVRPQGQGEPARPPTRPQPPPGAQPARPAPPGAQP